jgi:hypothetical protein
LLDDRVELGLVVRCDEQARRDTLAQLRVVSNTLGQRS